MAARGLTIALWAAAATAGATILAAAALDRGWGRGALDRALRDDRPRHRGVDRERPRRRRRRWGRAGDHSHRHAGRPRHLDPRDGPGDHRLAPAGHRLRLAGRRPRRLGGGVHHRGERRGRDGAPDQHRLRDTDLDRPGRRQRGARREDRERRRRLRPRPGRGPRPAKARRTDGDRGRERDRRGGPGGEPDRPGSRQRAGAARAARWFQVQGRRADPRQRPAPGARGDAAAIRASAADRQPHGRLPAAHHRGDRPGDRAVQPGHLPAGRDRARLAAAGALRHRADSRSGPRGSCCWCWQRR